MKGKVKRFDKDKGFGFIVGEDEKEYFFHFSEIVMEGFKTINPDTEVEFETSETEKGLRANHVVAINQEEAAK